MNLRRTVLTAVALNENPARFAEADLGTRRHRRGLGRLLQRGQCQHECAPVPETVTVGADGASVQFHDTLDQCETDPEATRTRLEIVNEPHHVPQLTIDHRTRAVERWMLHPSSSPSA